MQRYRQEVLNVVLAQLLDERGVVLAPESIRQLSGGAGRSIPDVLVRFRGLRVAIEGEVADAAAAMDKAIGSAARRVKDGIAHIGIAVVYPSELRSVPFASLKQQMADASLTISLVSEAGDTGPRQAGVNELEQALRHIFDQLIQEDAVREAVALLSGAIDKFAQALQGKAGVRERLRRTLGIGQIDTSELQ